MYIDSIENGIVLDHITAGRGMRVYETLGLDALDCTVAILKNVPSGKDEKKGHHQDRHGGLAGQYRF